MAGTEGKPENWALAPFLKVSRTFLEGGRSPFSGGGTVKDRREIISSRANDRKEQLAGHRITFADRAVGAGKNLPVTAFGVEAPWPKRP